MRIAVVSPRNPIPIYSGLMERIYQLCQFLGKRHTVRVYFPKDSGQAPSDEGYHPDHQPFTRVELASKAINLLGPHISQYTPLKGLYQLHPWLILKLRRKFSRFEPEAVIVEMPYLFPIAYAATRGLECPLILSEHNVEHKLANRLDIRFSQLLKRFEIFVANRAHTVVTVSGEDSATLSSNLRHDRIMVAPNGVSLSRYRPQSEDDIRELREKYGIEIPHQIFTYHGQLGNAQNRESLHVLRNEIFPLIQTELPDASLLLIGANPPSIDEPNVIATGLVDDLPRHLALGDVALLPIKSGSGTKLKILEYLATGTPVVTTPIGAEGLPLTHGETALIASDPEELARNALRVIEHDELRDRLSEQGRQLAVNRFSWDQTLEPYEDVLSQVTGRPQSHEQ